MRTFALVILLGYCQFSNGAAHCPTNKYTLHFLEVKRRGYFLSQHMSVSYVIILSSFSFLAVGRPTWIFPERLFIVD
jgi:hypothetical protein